MKSSPKASLLILILVMIVSACRSDSQNNPRAYVEGKAVSSNLDKIYIKIVSSDLAVGQTTPDANGTFKLSGPLRSEGFSVVANEKIRSFKTDRTGL